MIARVLLGSCLSVGLAAPGPAQSTLATFEGGAFDRLGLSAGGRDLDGDGVGDFLLATPDDGQDAGIVTAYSGASGTALWARQGADGERFGHALVIVDDLTFDGVPDVVVGAPGAAMSPSFVPGAVRVLSGASGAIVTEYFGFADQGEMGFSVAGGFDYDRDGVDDIAGGQPAVGNGYEVWSGATGLSIAQSSSVAPVRIGHAMASVGDVDNDGFVDLAYGTPNGGGSGTSGSVKVVTQGSLILQIDGVAGQLLGWSIAPADDLNADGHADFLIGSLGGGSGAGQVELIDGASGSALDSWVGNAPFDQFGHSIARLGDLNGDGMADFAVGAPQPQGYGPGFVRVISLRFGTELYTVTGAAVDHEFGSHVGALGDVNHDGTPDLGVGAPGWDDPAFLIALDGGQVTFFSGGCPGFVNYCTAGTSSSGCQAQVSGSGVPSWFAPSGFTVSATGVEGDKSALFFIGWNGRQASPWGNGTSYQCVVPPVKRMGVLSKSGTPGLCDGSYAQDLNAHWSANPSKNPGPGTVVQAQLWYRDPGNTSNQSTSLSNALEFVVCN